MTLWSRLTGNTADGQDADETEPHRKTDGGQVVEPESERGPPDDEQAGMDSVRDGVREDQIALMQALAGGKPPEAEPAEMGERLLRQGAAPSSVASTLDVGIDSLLDDAFAKIESGDPESARTLLEDRLSELSTGLEQELQPYDEFFAAEDAEYADAVVTVEEVLEAIPFPVYMLDKDDRVIGWNYGHTALVQMSREEAIGKTAEDSVVKATYSEGARALTLAEKVVDCPRTADEEYGVTRYETRYSDHHVYFDQSTATNLDGETIYLDFWAVPIFDEDGEFKAVFEILKDRTEEKHRQDALESLVTEVTDTLEAASDGKLGATAEFEDENDVLEDELLTITTSINELLAELREIVQEIAGEATNLRADAREITETTGDVSEALDEQTTNVENVSDEITAMSASVEEVAATADDISELAQDSKEVSKEMQKQGTEAQEALTDVAETSTDVEGDIERLQTHLDEIDEIVDVIDAVADQTNMLALNASIEAARAGEAGEGFAVVADEIKQLANESQTHANEIDRTIEELTVDTQQTVDNLSTMNDQVTAALDDVEASMDNLQGIVDRIEETAEGVTQVARTADDQAQQTQTVASLADELVDGAREVATQVESVAEATNRQQTQVDSIEATLTRLAESDEEL